MLAFFGFGTSSDDDEPPAPRTPSLLDTLLGTPTKPADEVDRLAALHDKFREDLASAPLDDLRQAANEAASLSANDRAAGGWRLDAAARLRAEPEVQTQGRVRDLRRLLALYAAARGLARLRLTTK